MNKIKTIQDLKDNDLIIGEIICGSTLYGLNTPESDIDIKGIYKLSNEVLLGMEYEKQINDEKNDIVYYELGRFVELLCNNNPNMLEMLFVPDDKILIDSDIYCYFRSEEVRRLFLTKKCFHSFSNYAMGQVRKSRGLNKKITKEFSKEKKSLIDFCHVLDGADSYPLRSLSEKVNFGTCGVVNCQNGTDIYAIYEDNKGVFNLDGITKFERQLHLDGETRGEDSNNIRLHSIPKLLAETQKPINFSYNENGYRAYCKEYNSYWQWVNERNENRYNSTKKHGKGYDAKNMMHTFRLLAMGNEIALHGSLTVDRTAIDKEFLMKVRKGDFEYDYLLERADNLMDTIKMNYEKSLLPDKLNRDKINDVLVNARMNKTQVFLADKNKEYMQEISLKYIDRLKSKKYI